MDLSAIVESGIRSHHAYKEEWNLQTCDKLDTEVDELNQHDRYAVRSRVT